MQGMCEVVLAQMPSTGADLNEVISDVLKSPCVWSPGFPSHTGY